ncbi:MAG TPA: methyltransferase domain-containing protein [Thermoanaerobaculia bacterium]|nr:methyltransferase domain-containing protein [Thermoanaerobaculia bacterium]
MVDEYTAPPAGRLRALYRHLLASPGDMRTRASRRAFESLFETLPPDALCLSIGGGPVRVHPELVNVNLGPFPNVDVVGDAYRLPYANSSVDLVHCEAVLEHLEFPDRAVEEMFRVLRAEGVAFAATPFIQPYHAYPDHFQNFTLAGHRRLFERAGFIVLEAGTCVGPTFALRDLLLNYLRHVVPGGMLGRWATRFAALASLPLLYLDRLANERPHSSGLASSTFLKLKKGQSATCPAG